MRLHVHDLHRHNARDTADDDDDSDKDNDNDNDIDKSQ